MVPRPRPKTQKKECVKQLVQKNNRKKMGGKNSIIVTLVYWTYEKNKNKMVKKNGQKVKFEIFPNNFVFRPKSQFLWKKIAKSYEQIWRIGLNGRFWAKPAIFGTYLVQNGEKEIFSNVRKCHFRTQCCPIRFPPAYLFFNRPHTRSLFEPPAY